MLRSLQITVLGLVLVLLSNSCSDYQKVLKSGDPTLKLEKANEYFNKGDYFKALQLYDELIIIYRGRPQSEQIAYYYSYCYYNEQQYIMANYNFKNFVKSYPQSEFAEECMYMAAYCKYMISPKYSLDQQSTMEAIRELQLFVDMYPESERVQSCNDLIDELRQKVEYKDFERAKLYYDIERYQSAIFALKNFLEMHPGTSFKEEAMYYVTDASYIFAVNSISTKQKERYQMALDEARDYLSHFPEGKWAGQVGKIEGKIAQHLGI